jgi:AcrR family transcriptional regulator
MSPLTATGRGRKGEGERTREDILSAAEELLIATGSEDDVSIRSVAERVGVTPPSIYRHFPDKAHLLFEVCSRQFERMAEDVTAMLAADPDASPLDQLAAAGRAYARFGLANPEHYRIMFMGHADHTPELYDAARVLESGSFGLVIELARQAIDAGLLRRELRDPAMVAHVLWAAVHGVVSLAVAKPNLPAPDVVTRLDATLDVFLAGIAR